MHAPGWLSSYDKKTKRQWVLACGFVQRQAQHLPLFSEVEVERRMQLLLWGYPWARATWHCWRRLVAAAMVALGGPIAAVCVWGRRASQH